MATNKSTLTKKHLKEILHYEPESGIFTWLMATARRTLIGSLAGSTRTFLHTGKTYTFIQINNKKYAAHRLAWLYIYGEFPANEIDHIDGDGTNNRIDNLRDVTRAENSKNRRKPSNNTSGFLGIRLDKKSQKWIAHIGHNYKLITLGRFSSQWDAICARKSSEYKLNFFVGHGSTRNL